MVMSNNSLIYNTDGNLTATKILVTKKVLNIKKNLSNYKKGQRMKIGDLFTDSHASDKFKYVLIELWTLHTKLANTSAIPNFRQRPNFTRDQNPFLEKKIIPQPKTTPGKSTNLLALLTNSSWGKGAWFHDGFWRTNDRWPHWYGCMTSATSGTNSGNFPITSTPKEIKWKTTSKIPRIGREWIFRKVNYDDWTTLCRWGHTGHGSSFIHDKPDQPIICIILHTRKWYRFRQASGSTLLTFFPWTSNTETPHIPTWHTFVKSKNYPHPTSKTECHLHKITGIHREWRYMDNSILPWNKRHWWSQPTVTTHPHRFTW